MYDSGLRTCAAGQAAHAALAAELGARSGAKRSRFRGVCSNWNRWRAQIYVAGRRRELGSFATEGEAARVYDLAAIRRAWNPRRPKSISGTVAMTTEVCI